MPAHASACSGLSLGTAKVPIDNWVLKCGPHRVMTASQVTAFAWLVMASHEGKTQQGRFGCGGHNRRKPCTLMYPRIPSFKKDWGEGQQNPEGPGKEQGVQGVQGGVPFSLFLKEPSSSVKPPPRLCGFSLWPCYFSVYPYTGDRSNLAPDDAIPTHSLWHLP